MYADCCGNVEGRETLFCGGSGEGVKCRGTEEVDFVAGQHEAAIWWHEGELARPFFPAVEAHTWMEDGEGDGVGDAAWTTQVQNQVWDAGDFGGERDGPVCNCGEGAAGG